MLSTYTYPRYAYRRAPEFDASGQPVHHPVVVVGAGPVGLATAIDLAQRGQSVVLLDDDNTVSIGSRGLCYAKRTLDILDRLGCGQPVVDKGVTWNIGRTFFGTEEVFNFNLLPEAGHRRPGMVNLQQYYLEQFLVERAQQLPLLDLRWQHRVTQVQVLTPHGAVGRGARLTTDTVDGPYSLHADWLVVCDGARSPVRRMLGLDIAGKVFQDRFLIADVVLKKPLFAEGAAERWFWFDPPFHPGQSVLLHREADNVWRIDFQLGWDADPEAEKQPQRVQERIRAMLGPQCEFELEWVSVYTFQCRRMAQLRHGPVLFAGDAAHQVSPFGARGANSGVQDADNLAWKLKLVIDGLAPSALLESYAVERGDAADENLLNSTRSTDFITPKSQASRDLRNAVLGLAREHQFARRLVNSGRLSVPSHYLHSPLNTPDTDAFAGAMHPGAPLLDAPLVCAGAATWLLQLVGHGFVLLVFADELSQTQGDAAQGLQVLAADPVPVQVLWLLATGAALTTAALPVCVDVEGLAAARLDAQPGTAYLLRPDQHVAARWRHVDAASVRRAVARATAQEIVACRT